MYKKILVPLDGSKLAEFVLPHIESLAVCMGAEIILLRIPVPPKPHSLLKDQRILAVIDECTEAEVATYLEHIAEDLRQSNLKVTIEVGTGWTINAIVDFAESIHADLIAMSTHGCNGLAHWAIGSVAEKVARTSSVPVLLIHPTAIGLPRLVAALQVLN